LSNSLGPFIRLDCTPCGGRQAFYSLLDLLTLCADNSKATRCLFWQRGDLIHLFFLIFVLRAYWRTEHPCSTCRCCCREVGCATFTSWIASSNWVASGELGTLWLRIETLQLHVNFEGMQRMRYEPELYNKKHTKQSPVQN
jgi:hypothetical protein